MRQTDPHQEIQRHRDELLVDPMDRASAVRPRNAVELCAALDRGTHEREKGRAGHHDGTTGETERHCAESGTS